MAPAAKEFYEDQKNLNKLCNFLRSTDGPAVREAIMMDKRVYYIKGEKLVNFMVEPKKGTKWPKELPRFSSRPEAITVCKELCNIQYIHRSEKVAKGELEVARVRDFDESAYFTWIYEGDMTNKNLMTTALIIGFLCCTCFPIWPNFLKVFVWYMSVSLLIFIFFLVTLRAVVFLFVWIIGYEMWFLPNLFDESLGFCESFVPVISCEKTKDGQLMYRVGVFVAFSSFCYWAVTQPSEFDGFVKGQGDFIKDLYAGTLLSDISQKDKENIDKPKMPSLEDLLKKLDSEDEEEKELSEEEAAEALLNSLVEDSEDIDDEEE
ncbi:translocation protein SEC62 [Skeletonema marinoi]|uniref:Translocation protein SEC62 n=1 Tax=Skeletonema marinoi TaxID=267567 RepID=A0AAD9DI05_9STRA|nr:translocation protein SEC62 [Skeletonema marinoi]